MQACQAGAEPTARLKGPLPTNNQYSISDKLTECPKAGQDRTFPSSEEESEPGSKPRDQSPHPALAAPSAGLDKQSLQTVP